VDVVFFGLAAELLAAFFVLEVFFYFPLPFLCSIIVGASIVEMSIIASLTFKSYKSSSPNSFK